MSFTWLAFNPSLAFPPLNTPSTPSLCHFPPSSLSPPSMQHIDFLCVLAWMVCTWSGCLGGLSSGMERKEKSRERVEKMESERRASSLIHLSQSSCPEAREVGRIRWGERALLMPGMCVCGCECVRVSRGRESERPVEKISLPLCLPGTDDIRLGHGLHSWVKILNESRSNR